MALVDLKPSAKLWPGVLAVGMTPDRAGDVTGILFMSWSVIHLKRTFGLRGEAHIKLARRNKQVLGKP